ncbi:MAG: endonuclease [Bacilli bacterium]|nr:endonuclease [Bacilli bacterium]
MNKRKVKIVLTSLITCVILGLSSCGENPAPHVHTFSTEWSVDEVYHWHAATCEHTDLKSDYAVHEWGEWVIDREATPKQKGLKHHECTTCSYELYEEFDYLAPANRVYLPTDLKKCAIAVGSTRTLTPVIFPVEAYKNIKYVIDDEEVLEIDENTGILTGKSVGTSVITAYNDNNNDGKLNDDEPRNYACYDVQPKKDQYSITLPSYEMIIKVDEVVELSPTAHGFVPDINKWNTYVYNEEVASSYQKQLKGLKPGVTEVSIYQTPADEEFAVEARLTLTVIENTDASGLRAYGVDFKEETKNVFLGDEFDVEYEISPKDSIDKNVSFTIKGNAISYDGSKFHAVKAGSSIIEVKTPNQKVDRMKVVVSENQEYAANYNNYYGNLTWTDGEDLKAKLHDIISTNKRKLTYTNSNWDSNKDADSLIGDSTKVNVLYSDDPVNKDATQSGWQREHCFAASLMTGIGTGDATKTLGRATDFHNLYASYASGNQSRGNKNFGYANKDSLRYTVPDNDGSYCYDLTWFEPSDLDKGKLARAIFYMGVMYNKEEQFSYEGVTYKALPIEIIEDNVNYNDVKFADLTGSLNQEKALLEKYVDIIKEEYPTITSEVILNKIAYRYFKDTNSPSAIGNLSELLMWNSFSVDNQEMQHNNSVYSYNSPAGGAIQANRNPFVDYPQLVEYVYGSLKDQPGNIKNLKPAILDLDVTVPEAPTQGPEEVDTRFNTPMGNCNWNYIPLVGNKGDYNSIDAEGLRYDVLFNDKVFELTFGQSTSTFNNKNTANAAGVTIGTSTKPISTFVFESLDNYVDVDSVYFYACGASKSSYPFTIYVNDIEVTSGTITGSTPTCYGGTFTKTSGKVKISVSGINAAFVFAGIGINSELN